MPIVMRSSRRWLVWCAYAALLVFIVFLLLPFLTIVSISLRPGNFAGGHLIPRSISLEHWKVALGMSYVDADGTLVKPPFPILTWILNSLKISFVSATVNLLLALTSAYAFARMRFRGRGPMLRSMLLLQMFQPVLALVAIYSIFDRSG